MKNGVLGLARLRDVIIRLRSSVPRSSRFGMSRPFWIATLLLLAAVATLGRVCVADFITSWDDGENVLHNPHVNPPTWAGVKWHWQHPFGQMHIPVTYSAW